MMSGGLPEVTGALARAEDSGGNLDGFFRSPTGNAVYVFSQGYYCGSAVKNDSGSWSAFLPKKFIGLNQLAPRGELLEAGSFSWERSSLLLIRRHERPLVEAREIVRAVAG